MRAPRERAWPGLALAALLWPAVAPAAAPRPVLPPPDLSPLLRLAAPALDKPPVPVPVVPLPPPPEPVPALPALRPASDPATRPTAPLAPPRVLACNPLGSVFGVVSELLECGRARYQRGELEEARADLQAVVQRGTDRLVIREGRYWLAETLLRLGQREPAETQLDLVARDDPGGELGGYAAHALGWLRLERGDAARALLLFEGVLRGGAPPDLVPSARHGRAMTLYALGRLAEARDEWTALLGQSIPQALATEATLWLGETLGRLGDAAAAVGRLVIFTAAGPRLHIDAGLLRLAWYRRAAGDPLEAAKGYRGLLSAYPRSPELRWARAGLVLALLDLGDVGGAVEEAGRLEAGDPAGTLARPVLLELARRLVTTERPEAPAQVQALLGRELPGPTRAYALVLSGELARRRAEAGDAGEGTMAARTAFEQARALAGADAVGAYAALRLAQLELGAREHDKARTLAESLLGESAPPPVRRAALVVAAEAAYAARDHDRAAGLFERLAAEAAGETRSAARLALGWAEYRRGRLPEARRQWAALAAEGGRDPRAGGALLLAAELAAEAGDDAGAIALLDRLLSDFPDHEHGTVARLDRAILRMRAGRGGLETARELETLLSRAALSPYVGRVRLARAIALVQAGRAGQARDDFRAALGEGEEAARLGLGLIAFQDGRWDEALRELTAARDATGGAVADAAEYGMAAALFNHGRTEDYRRMASALLGRRPPPAAAPQLLRGLAWLAGEERRWAEARELAARLGREHAEHPATAEASAALARRAAAAGEWALAREQFQRLAERFPQHPTLRDGQLDFAEALLRTGAPAEARPVLLRFLQLQPADPDVPRAQLLLARVQEATGDRAAALAIYERLRREHPGAPGAETAMLAQGRLLAAEGRLDEARPLLERAIDTGDAAVAGEAAYHLGEGLRAAGRHREAAEAYMTAAYLAPDAPWAARALLGAGRAFAATEDRGAAATVYRKLLAAPGLEPELADQARRELAALGTR